jgi:hypothetical protein
LCSVRQQVLELLEAARPQALLLSEVEARLQTPLGDVLPDLERAGAVLVTTPAPPDPHLAALDLRIVARTRHDDPQAALAATQAVWGRYLREFLASHHCQ